MSIFYPGLVIPADETVTITFPGGAVPIQFVAGETFFDFEELGQALYDRSYLTAVVPPADFQLAMAPSLLVIEHSWAIAVTWAASPAIKAWLGGIADISESAIGAIDFPFYPSEFDFAFSCSWIPRRSLVSLEVRGQRSLLGDGSAEITTSAIAATQAGELRQRLMLGEVDRWLALVTLLASGLPFCIWPETDSTPLGIELHITGYMAASTASVSVRQTVESNDEWTSGFDVSVREVANDN